MNFDKIFAALRDINFKDRTFKVGSESIATVSYFELPGKWTNMHWKLGKELKKL